MSQTSSTPTTHQSLDESHFKRYHFSRLNSVFKNRIFVYFWWYFNSVFCKSKNWYESFNETFSENFHPALEVKWKEQLKCTAKLKWHLGLFLVVQRPSKSVAMQLELHMWTVKLVDNTLQSFEASNIVEVNKSRISL